MQTPKAGPGVVHHPSTAQCVGAFDVSPLDCFDTFRSELLCRSLLAVRTNQNKIKTNGPTGHGFCHHNYVERCIIRRVFVTLELGSGHHYHSASWETSDVTIDQSLEAKGEVTNISSAYRLYLGEPWEPAAQWGAGLGKQKDL